MLATEPNVAQEEKRAPLPPLETAAANERLRHIPSLEWMIRKVDVDLRRRIENVLAVYSALAPADPRHDAMQTELRALCKSIERLADAVKPGRHGGNGSADVGPRIETLLAEAIACLRALDAQTFGRRNPYHFFERSKSECVYGALLSVICHTDRVIALARTIDPGIDERLLEGLVVLQIPDDDRMRHPIA